MLLLVLVAVAATAAMVSADAAGSGAPIGLPSCTTSCGGVSVPYPFGISPGCYLPRFGLTCDTSRDPPRLLLGGSGATAGILEIVAISLVNSTVRVHGPKVGLTGPLVQVGETVNGTWGGAGWGFAEAGPYALSSAHNELILTGCDLFAELLTKAGEVISSCRSVCTNDLVFWGALELPGQAGHRGRKCSGINCCQAPVFLGFSSYEVRLSKLAFGYSDVGILSSYVVIAEEGWFDLDRNITAVVGEAAAIPAVLQWWVPSRVLRQPNETRDGNVTCPTDLGGSGTGTTCHSSFSSCEAISINAGLLGKVVIGYTCKCHDGYQGNPYLTHGCQDVDECKLPGRCYGTCINKPGTYSCQCPEGTHGDAHIQNGCVKPRESHAGLFILLAVGSGAMLLCIVISTTFLINKVKEQRQKRQRQRFFKQNHGQLLQQLVCHRTDIAERMIITLEELEKATNNFDEARELGGGGHGTVYKGILSTLHVVAIKRSKITIKREIDEFINEVAILSQVNHRNIVKLLGCCLETEVPLLVYEFISNGTLYNHLHVEASISLPWKDRLRIAVETARAITYLHSFASMPIIHRDIKSPNILLDDNLTVKLSDFGASRHIPIDQTGVHTTVQGTLGYLDPMYHCTGHLTEKSDVYSFGVLLIELLTKKKPVSYISCQGYGLVEHFVSIVTQGNLDQVLDPQVAKEGDGEVIDIALLAPICVKHRGVERPTMRQVEMTLESIQVSKEYASTDMTNDDRAEGNQFWLNDLPTEGSNHGARDEEVGNSVPEEECYPPASLLLLESQKS